jgi:Ca2+-binding RTX toxin-like protein
MKRHRLFILALVVMAAMAFGANAAFANSLNFNPQTGELSYTTGGIAFDQGDQVTVRHAETGGFKSWIVIEFTGWQFGQPPVNDGIINNCFNEEYVLWACPATNVSVRTAKGNDTITVSPDVKIPTVLEGASGSDVISGGGGPDEIWGACKNLDPACNGSSDTLIGGAGNDSLHGSDGSHDKLYGEQGDDLLDGGIGLDDLFGGGDTDLADYSSRTTGIVASLDGAANDGAPGENDFIANDVEGVQGGSGNDTINGNDSANVLRGGGGNDYLDAHGGPDYLSGEGGSDLLHGGLGSDTIYGGGDPGASCCSSDTASWSERSNPVNVSIDGNPNDGEAGEGDFVASDVENLTGGSNDDVLIGDQHGNKLIGGAGNDTLLGMGGGFTSGLYISDKLEGWGDNDTLYGAPAAGLSPDTLDGGTGTDLVTYASRADGVQIWLDGSARTAGTRSRTSRMPRAERATTRWSVPTTRTRSLPTVATTSSSATAAATSSTAARATTR